ncbi:MAG: winged helix DNA-binding domain-containing protein [Chloroflexota bacterium]|nr:winged helix DNA-binding domain-containing protein [Chloroflexota bacterium]
MLTLTPTLARRLAITRQRLAGPRPTPDAAGILATVRDLGCLQLDPTRAVERTHLLVLWSRLGAFDPAALDQLLWQDRSLFEFWAHCASIVLTEDYPLYYSAQMRDYAKGDSGGSHKVRTWMADNHALHDYILAELAARGPLRSGDFEDRAVVPWPSSGWTNARNVGRMLDFLWSQGHIMVAGRKGGQKLWDLTARCLPAAVLQTDLSTADMVRQAAQKSLRALGVATARDISNHFMRGCYPGLDTALAALEAEGTIQRVQIADARGEWPGPYWMHTADAPLLADLAAGAWEPRTTLLSPFDNLICDRARTERLFGFRYRIEIYVPQAQREYGFYVLPILHGDRLIGRVDPVMDRKQGVLRINAVYAEPDAPAEAAPAVADAIRELGAFLAATTIEYSNRVPAMWADTLGQGENTA